MEAKTDILVIGGGITGLSIAYLAARSGRSVTILESGEKLGGLLDTFEIGGAQLEKFYHHFFLHDQELHWLLNELDLNSRIIYKETSMGVYREDKIYNFNTLMDLLRFAPLNLFDKLRFGLTSFALGKIFNWRKHEHISAHEWFKKWSGQNVTSTIWEPLLRVKFGSHYKDVPLAWMIGRLGQRLNSRKDGREMLGYLDGSLQVLNDQLTQKLKSMGVQIHTSSPATGLIQRDDRIVGVVSKQKKFEAENVIATVPNHVIANLVDPIDKAFSRKLNEVEYFGAVCTVLELDRPLSNIYWLNIADVNFPFGGVIEQTNLIAPENYGNRNIAYLSRYFTKDEEIATMDEASLKQLMLNGVEKAFPTFKQEDLRSVHVFRTNTAATVCDLNFSSKVKKCQSYISGFTVANMMHIYPDERSVNNAIRVAANICSSLGIDCMDVPNGNSLSGEIGIN